jgi:hypothetical protein
MIRQSGGGERGRKEPERVVKAASADITDSVDAEFDIDPADFIDPEEFDYWRRESA